MPVRIRWSGLRSKIIAWSFVPTAIILATVALVGFYAYQQVTQNLTVQSSREVARLSAGQLAAELSEYSNLLTTLARTSAISNDNPDEQRAALTQASSRLTTFDGGVLILNDYGTVVAAQPARTEILGHDWSSRDYYRQMIRVPGIVYSDVVNDGPGGAPVIVVAVPIINAPGELVGTLLGMFRVSAASVSSFYSSIVMLRFDASEDAYLVDRNGLVIYHPNSSWIGQSLAAQPVVQQAMSGKVDALRTRNASGREIVASFAPVPGTPWSLVTEQSWSVLLAAGQRYAQFLLLLLALGLIVPAVVVTIGVRRITEPINRLIVATAEVAGGNLGHTTTIQTGDEIEDLSKQFNRMSARLAVSYTTLKEREAELVQAQQVLEQRVMERTRELATLNTIAGVVSGTLDLKEIMGAALDKAMEAMRMDIGTAYSLQPGDTPDEDKLLLPAAGRGLSAEFSQHVGSRRLRGTGIQVAAEAHKPLVWLVADYPDPVLKPALEREGVRQVISIPLFAKGKFVGAFNLGTRHEREITPEEISLLGAIGQQVAVAVENAHLYDRAEQSAALAERSRLARELHDSVTQSLYGVTMYAEAAQLSLTAGDHLPAAQYLCELRDTAQEALREMRLLVYELRPPALEKRGLAAALQERLETVEARGGVKTELHVEGAEALPLPLQDELYHIAREALNNTLKHARAQTVRVMLACADGSACLEISDDGLGFDPSNQSKGGLGLAGMKERVQKIGGHLDIETAAGHGTRLVVHVPLPLREAE